MLLKASHKRCVDILPLGAVVPWDLRERLEPIDRHTQAYYVLAPGNVDVEN